jgi:hypothetical protein
VKVFEAPEYSKDELTKFFEREIKKEGLLSKKKLETLDSVQVIHRPFRRIKFELDTTTGPKTSVSFIDEQLSSSISDGDHRFLLWRPRLADYGISDSEVASQEGDNTDAINEVVDELILHRWNGQELDDELRPKLRSLQADPLTTIAFIIPRSPHGLKREETILAERTEIHSFVVASSLVTNSSPKDIMISAEIGEQVHVKTIVAEFRNVATNGTRLLCLETPGRGSLQDAKKSGKALTRISELYPECREIIVQSYVL